MENKNHLFDAAKSAAGNLQALSRITGISYCQLRNIQAGKTRIGELSADKLVASTPQLLIKDGTQRGMPFPPTTPEDWKRGYLVATERTERT